MLNIQLKKVCNLTFSGRHGVLSPLMGGGWTKGPCERWGHRFGGQLHHEGASLGIDYQRISRLLDEGLGHTCQERTATHYHIHYQQRWLSQGLEETGKHSDSCHSFSENLFRGCWLRLKNTNIQIKLKNVNCLHENLSWPVFWSFKIIYTFISITLTGSKINSV